MTPAFLGIDIGTSGIRGCCIDENAQELCNYQLNFDTSYTNNGYNEQRPTLWLSLLDKLITEIAEQLQQQDARSQINAIAIDGTSSTLIACKKDGTPLSPALMYNDQQAHKQAEVISRFAPAESAVHGASSSLAKALLLLEKYPETEILCHQADWLAAYLTGRYGLSDENNCLKLGYDSIRQQWPDWLLHNNENAVISESILPQVVAPGSVIGHVKTALIKKYRSC